MVPRLSGSVGLMNRFALVLCSVVACMSIYELFGGATSRITERSAACMISCTGSDGYGHQLEAKLTCIAVAQHLGLEYVHIPFFSMEHGVDPGEAEELLGLGHNQPNFVNTMQLTPRPLTPVGDCDSPSWFDDYTDACKKDGISVYSADNCWDYFWCALRRPEFRHTWFKRTLPSLQKALSLSKLGSAVVQSMVAHSDVVSIMVHIRRGDAGARGVPTEWFWKTSSAVIAQLGRQRPHSKVLMWVHSDDAGIYSSFAQSAAYVPVGKALQGGGLYTPANSTLELFGTHMLAADVAILSCSSLSHAFGMLRNKTVIYPGSSVPGCHRVQARWLGWSFISVKKPEEDVSGLPWSVLLA